jgi:hypothetical protein
MKPYLSKISVVSLKRKMNVVAYQYRVGIPLYSEEIVLRIWVCVVIANFNFIVMPILFFHIQ